MHSRPVRGDGQVSETVERGGVRDGHNRGRGVNIVGLDICEDLVAA